MAKQGFTGLLFVALCALTVSGFVPGGTNKRPFSSGVLHMVGTEKSFRVPVTLPNKVDEESADETKKEVLIFEPLLKEKSKIVEVRYDIPCSLNIEQCENTGLPICYLPGFNGDVPNDILRYTSAWTENGDCIMHDCCAGTWEECVEALCSNNEDNGGEIVLLYERALSSIYNV
mmetsp:Transcript_4923/g.7413  ORF Transcript_4923/g.7413 Transcript_4923/m.7413 type:complete len:174 (-) Transcript_4923:177-698(-)|eukprot:CAMPEP_0196802234 /NCGR_PEP_ID=MMETSP1362-20130617/1881_1 /TAXON_ID=163516 /ORGANISM="Leptocylindrus danicus, Strain CCMP1856" /LENGTH=173 /DNA_ID=CAMNT_0042173473 /DNA_START=234 /DNA_END=755 /DNA_ORIENTATION=-